MVIKAHRRLNYPKSVGGQRILQVDKNEAANVDDCEYNSSEPFSTWTSVLLNGQTRFRRGPDGVLHWLYYSVDHRFKEIIQICVALAVFDE